MLWKDVPCAGVLYSPAYVKRDHCTALRAMQHPSMTPTSLLGVWGGCTHLHMTQSNVLASRNRGLMFWVCREGVQGELHHEFCMRNGGHYS